MSPICSNYNKDELERRMKIFFQGPYAKRKEDRVSSLWVIRKEICQFLNRKKDIVSIWRCTRSVMTGIDLLSMYHSGIHHYKNDNTPQDYNTRLKNFCNSYITNSDPDNDLANKLIKLRNSLLHSNNLLCFSSRGILEFDFYVVYEESHNTLINMDQKLQTTPLNFSCAQIAPTNINLATLIINFKNAIRDYQEDIKNEIETGGDNISNSLSCNFLSVSRKLEFIGIHNYQSTGQLQVSTSGSGICILGDPPRLTSEIV